MLFNTLYIGSPKDCVIHHGDHEQFRLTLFCPQLYFQGALMQYLGRIRNFLNNYPILHKKRNFVFNRLFPLTWSESIHGAFAKKPPCRMDLSLWNGRKDWQKGPTLICYFQSYQSTLLKAVSRCLDPMLREVWPQQLGQQSVPQIWNTIRSAFREIPEAAHLQFLNDDLVGFFNSVPQDRLLAWCSSGIDGSMERPSPRRSLNSSIADLSATGDPIQSTFAGTYRKSAYNVRSIKVDRPLHHCEGQPQQSLF